MEMKNQTYYLVAPGCMEQGNRKSFFWSLDIGDKWIGVARNIYRPKHKDDIIQEAAEAGHITELDWTKTPFHDNTSSSGWLSPYGRFFGCPQIFHDLLANIVIGMKVAELERLGWVRVFDSQRFTCERRLSPEQRNWLSERGYRFTDSY